MVFLGLDWVRLTLILYFTNVWIMLCVTFVITGGKNGMVQDTLHDLGTLCLQSISSSPYQPTYALVTWITYNLFLASSLVDVTTPHPLSHKSLRHKNIHSSYSAFHTQLSSLCLQKSLRPLLSTLAASMSLIRAATAHTSFMLYLTF